jgi:hypothetical protein
MSQNLLKRYEVTHHSIGRQLYKFPCKYNAA